jgi:hypothetical protein
MRLEAGASRLLEIDLVLEQHRGLRHQHLDRTLQPSLHQLAELDVKLAKVLDPLHQPHRRIIELRLVVHHLDAGPLGAALELLHP